MCNFAKLLGHDVTVDTPIPRACSSLSRYCLTVSVLLFDPRGNLVLVHHPRAEGRDLTPLQTTVQAADGTLGGAVKRALRSKLNVRGADTYERAIHIYLNIVPRGNEPCKAKTVVVFMAFMAPGAQLHVNREKVQYVETVTPETLVSRLPGDRQAKCAGTIASCLAAAVHDRRMSAGMRNRYLRALSPSD